MTVIRAVAWFRTDVEVLCKSDLVNLQGRNGTHC